MAPLPHLRDIQAQPYLLPAHSGPVWGLSPVQQALRSDIVARRYQLCPAGMGRDRGNLDSQ